MAQTPVRGTLLVVRFIAVAVALATAAAALFAVGAITIEKALKQDLGGRG
jgi:hypothetical protein